MVSLDSLGLGYIHVTIAIAQIIVSSHTVEIQEAGCFDGHIEIDIDSIVCSIVTIFYLSGVLKF